MVNQTDQKHLRERMDALPKPIQDYLGSSEITAKILDIVQAYRFGDSEFTAFVDFIRNIYLKDIPFENVVDVLRDSILPKTIDAKIFFHDLEQRRLFQFKEHLTDQSYRAVPRPSPIIPSEDDVKRLTGVEIRKVILRNLRPAGKPIMVQRFMKTLPQKKSVSMKGDFSSIIDEIIRIISPSFSESSMMRRFRAVVIAYFKDVRDTQETLNTLRRGSKIGGLRCSDNEAQRIMDYLKRNKQVFLASFHRPSATPSQVQTPKQPTSNPPHSISVGQKSKTLAAKQSLPSKPISIPLVKKQPSMPSTAQSPAQARPLASDALDHDYPRPIRMRRPVIPLKSDRPIMTDIKHPREVMGPIDELRYFSLKDFRDAAETAAGSAQKIFEKFQLLGAESVQERIRGILAWKDSPVNQLYIHLGKEAMAENQPVEELLEQKEKLHQPYLTKGEFMAIADLNRRLRF